MPTNFLRGQKSNPTADGRLVAQTLGDAGRMAELTVGGHRFEIALTMSHTAELVWRALPLFSFAETWGESLHFEVPLKAGRDRTARLNARPGEVYYWADDDRIVVVWGMTPISRDGEIRLMRPCNVLGHVSGDLAVLTGLQPGTKVALARS